MSREHRGNNSSTSIYAASASILTIQMNITWINMFFYSFTRCKTRTNPIKRLQYNSFKDWWMCKDWNSTCSVDYDDNMDRVQLNTFLRFKCSAKKWHSLGTLRLWERGSRMKKSSLKNLHNFLNSTSQK